MAAKDWLKGSSLRYVAKVALAAMAAFALTLGGRNDYALFSAMGAAMIVGGSLGEDLTASLNRVRGTLAGTAVGLAVAIGLGASIWTLGLAAASIAWICLGFGWGAAAMRIGMAMALVILFTHTDDTAHYALWRAANTLLGVGIGLVIGRLLWPIRGRDRISGAIERLLGAIAATLQALAEDAKPKALLQRDVEVLDAMASLRSARKDARVESRVGGDEGMLARETMLSARAGIMTLQASLRFGSLTPAESLVELHRMLREAFGSLAACALAAPGPGAAAPETELAARLGRAEQELGRAELPAEERSSLHALLDELRQLQATLRQLREARAQPGG